MIRERALELAQGIQDDDHLAEKIADAILAAVAEEKEACARIVEELDVWEFPSVSRALASAASTIRERKP